MPRTPDRDGDRGRIGWLLLACAIALEVAASLSLKAALEAPALYVVVVLGYAGSFACLGAGLRRGLPLGVAYGIWGATGVALTATLSTLLFAEPFTPLMGAGIACIIGGVLLVELGSQQAQRRAAALLATTEIVVPVDADAGSDAAAADATGGGASDGRRS